jgi:hypothetical protein
MAINLEMLTAIEGLNEDQKKAIVALSENDEKTVIDTKVAELYNGIDADVKAITGKEKPATIKTYEHLKKVLGDYVGQLDSLKEKNKELTTAIEEGKGDDKLVNDLKAELTTAKNQAEALQQKVDTITQEWQGKFQEKETELNTYRKKGLIEKALGSLQFTDDKGITESIKNVMKKNAIDAIMQRKSKIVQDEDGAERLVFLDENDLPVTNPKNQQLPLAPVDVLQENLKDILVTNRSAAGGGGKPGGGAQTGGDITGYRIKSGTKSQADIEIYDYLVSQGKQPGSIEYLEAQKAIYQENKVSELPEK